MANDIQPSILSDDLTAETVSLACKARSSYFEGGSAKEKPTAATDSAEQEAPRHEGCPLAEINETEISYPEGGLRAWLVVLGSFMGMVVSLGTVSTIGIFHAYLSKHQLKDYSESAVGWIFGVYVFLAFFCGVQIGPIFDAHGPRLLVLAGSIFMVTSMLLLGLCTHYWHFVVVFGVLGGVGTALIFTPALAAIGHFFHKRRGKATGVAASGGALGGVVFPLVLQRLFSSVGFVWATRVLAFVFVFCTSFAMALTRSRLPRKPGQSIIPDLGILKRGDYLLATIGIYFMEWALFVPITYLATFSASMAAISSAVSFEVVAIMNASSCLGRWTSGYIADRLGCYNSMVAALALCAATTLSLWFPLSIIDSSTADPNTVKAFIVVYALLFGFVSGSNISLAPVCVGQLCDTNWYGRYYATCYTIVSFGTLTGIPIAGALIQLAGDRYWAVACWTFLCYVVSLGCFILSRACQVSWKWRVKV